MPVIVSIILNLATAYLAMRRTKTWLNPFSGIMVFFALSGVFLFHSPLVESTNITSEVLPETEWYIFAFSAGFLMMTFLLKPESFRERGMMVCRPLPMTALLFGCAAACAIGTAMLFLRNGSLPVFLMSQSFAAGKGTRYQDFLIPFMTPLTWGLSRFMFMLLALDYLLGSDSLMRHVTRNWYNYGLSALALLLVLGAGLRNVLLWPAVFFLFGFSRKFGVTRRQTFAIGGVLIAFATLFILIGNYRLGSFSLADSPLAGLIVVDTGNPILQSAFTWIASYAGTCYFNLNAMIQVPPEPGHGLLLLTEVIPDVLLADFVKVPEGAIEYLTSNDLLPYVGLTFRTIFTDLYADFGYAGSILAGLVFYGFSVIAYNRSGTNYRWLCIYMCILPGLLMFPFLNFYTGLASLVPVILTFACVRVRPAATTLSSGASVVVASAHAFGHR